MERQGSTASSYSPAQAYPGNAYVDYVGTDVYDEFWGRPRPRPRTGPTN